MTDLLKKAFDVASRLPEHEQDAVAEWLLTELASERDGKVASPGRKILCPSWCMGHWTNTKEVRLKSWILRGFEVQDNPPVSGSFLSLARASKRQSTRSLPEFCREPESPRTALQASSSDRTDLLSPNKRKLQSARHQ